VTKVPESSAEQFLLSRLVLLGEKVILGPDDGDGDKADVDLVALRMGRHTQPVVAHPLLDLPELVDVLVLQCLELGVEVLADG